MSKPLFITFEGIDGSGKSSIMKQLPVVIHNYESTCVSTKEPLDGPFRNMLLTDSKLPSIIQHQLVVGSRRENNEQIIKPALAAGKHVFCDRYLLSTIVYQLTNINDEDVPERFELTAAIIEKYHNEFNFLYPDITFILDINSNESDRRVNNRSEDSNHFDLSSSIIKDRRAKLFKMIHEISLDPLAKPKEWSTTKLKIGNMIGKTKIHLIDAKQPLDKVARDICEILSTKHGIKTIYG